MFGFTDTQAMFQREIRAFARKELAPDANARAKLDHMTPEIIRKISDMGLLAMNLAEEYGGQPSDWVSTGIAIEELARVDVAAALLLFPAKVVGIALNYGNESTRSEWLPPLIKGEKLAALALTEPDCGSDAAAMKTKAVPDGEVYRITGEKTSVSWGMQADVAVVFAKTDAVAGAQGVSCFLVPLDLPGVSRSSFEDMGWKQVGRASFFLDDVPVPATCLIGEENRGFQLAMKQFDFARVGLGLTALGMAQESLESAVAYARERRAFGKPIARFEGVSFKLAEDATHIEAARLLCYRALWLRDMDKDHTKESAMCKWWCPEVALRAIHNALLIHGHIGYSTEYALERHLRDAIGFEFADGPAQIMKLIIVREIIGRDFLP